jgi:hypothetical protein
MKKPPRTYPWIVWPDGRTVRIRRQGRMWHWGTAASSHFDAIVDHVKANGGHIERRPNPSYESELQRYHDRITRERLDDILQLSARWRR